MFDSVLLCNVMVTLPVQGSIRSFWLVRMYHLVLRLLGTLTDFFRDIRQVTNYVKAPLVYLT